MINPLIVERIRALDGDARKQFVAGLPKKLALDLIHHWPLWARPAQLPPAGDWRTWLILAGRGFGKTRTGAEWVIDIARRDPTARIALVGATTKDVRKVMIKGESGILSVSHPSFRPVYLPSLCLLRWPNGAQAETYSAEEPERLRGPQHTHAWADELCAWKYPDAWDQLMLGLRLGTNPQVCVTTTPKPTDLLQALIEAKTTHITKGRTYDNLANLAPAFATEIITKYEGTALGRQELEGELVWDVADALWLQDEIHDHRWKEAKPPQLVRIVVAVDPAVSSHGGSDLTGIVVVGVDARGHGYVLEDKSGRYAPSEWAQVVVDLYKQHQANYVVAEANQGGELVRQNIHTVAPMLPVTMVHASKGKFARMEPIANLAKRGFIHHVGVFKELEKELTTYSPTNSKRSPDRADAMTWGFFDLMVRGTVQRSVAGFSA